MLTVAQLNHVCLYNAGSRQCRYLEKSSTNWKHCNCVKLISQKKRARDRKVKKILDECKLNGIDPEAYYFPLGDGANCKGYPYLPTVLQGYDMPHGKKP